MGGKEFLAGANETLNAKLKFKWTNRLMSTSSKKWQEEYGHVTSDITSILQKK